MIRKYLQAIVLLISIICAQKTLADGQSDTISYPTSDVLEIKTKNVNIKKSEPLYYLPQSTGRTEVTYYDEPVNLPRWGTDIDLGRGVGVAMDVVPAGSYQGRIVVARLHRMYGAAADTIRVYYSNDGGSSWNQWWAIYTLGNWQFWEKISISCSRTKVAVFSQLFSSSIETDFVSCDIFDFSGSHIAFDVDSLIFTGIPPMDPDCTCDAEDFSTDIWFYVVYMKPWNLEFRAFDENGGVHNSTTICSEGWYPDIDWDFDNLFVTYWYYINQLIYATFSPNYGSSWNGPFLISMDPYSLWPKIAGHGFSAVVVMEWPIDGIAYRYTTDFGNSWNPTSGMYLPCDSTDVCPSVTEVNSTNQYSFFYAKGGNKAYKAWMNPTSNQWYDHLQIGDVSASILDEFSAHDIRYLWNSSPAKVGAVWIDDRTGWYHAWFDCGNVGIEENNERQQTHNSLRIFPNPITVFTTIQYSVRKKTHVELAVYNAIGRQVDLLVNKTQLPGDHQINWNITSFSLEHLPNGIYFLQLKADNFIERKKMVVLR